MIVSENHGFSPQIIHGLIGFSIIFTIHFVVPLVLETPIYIHIYHRSAIVFYSGFQYASWKSMEIQSSAGASCLSLMSPSPSAVRLCHILGPKNDWLSMVSYPPGNVSYPTWGKRKSSSNMTYQGDMLIPWRVHMIGFILLVAEILHQLIGSLSHFV